MAEQDRQYTYTVTWFPYNRPQRVKTFTGFDDGDQRTKAMTLADSVTEYFPIVERKVVATVTIEDEIIRNDAGKVSHD